MKSQLLLLQCLLQELGRRCGTSTRHDYKYIVSRVEDEGFSFLTITLPQFGKDLEKALDQGEVTKSLFLGYRKKGCLPKLLSGFTGRIFDVTSGQLLTKPSIDAIHAVRQISYLFSKVDLPCSDARDKAAIEKYVEVEQELKYRDTIDPVFPATVQDFQRIGWLIFGNVFSRVDIAVYENDLFPKHGPGATADKLRGNLKFDQTEWTERLEEVFESNLFALPSLRHHAERAFEVLAPGAERPTRVITVPKTLKTPRIIAIEPTCMQYMQQAIWLRLKDEILRNNHARNFVGLDEQETNRDLARLGSLTGEFATLDLSEASDRVSNQHVRALVAPWFWLAKALDATRSRKADVPGYGVLRLSKFASMGSALCFPVEAIVFTTLIFLGIERELCRPLTHRDLSDLYGKVRVFGDDIVVPVDFVRSVVSTLQDFGLVVNENKSFWTGKFRESCGKEYYNGHDVSIVKARRVLPTHRKHVPEIISAVSLMQQLDAACLWDTADFLAELLEEFIPLPYVLPESQGLGRHAIDGSYSIDRICPNLQKPLVRAAVVVAKSPSSKLDGLGALLKCLSKQGDTPFEDDRHLERAGRPDRLHLKIRWVSPT